jgi:dolichyl-phosphate beta-glucosyltransferase
MPQNFVSVIVWWSLLSALDLSVVVPAYNEAQRLPTTLQILKEYLSSYPGSYEVLIVNDGSSDETPAIVEKAQSSWPQLQLVSMGVNSGKGAAVRKGMLMARGRLRLFSDADTATPIRELAKLEAALDEFGAGVAIAARTIPGSAILSPTPWHRALMSRGYSWLVRHLLLPDLHDTQCGFKLFEAQAANECFAHLTCRRFGFDVEVLFTARQRNIKIVEVPVEWHNSQGSKVNSIRDSLQMFFDLCRLRRKVRRRKFATQSSSEHDTLKE